MTERNPMRRDEWRMKMQMTLLAQGHRPPIRGGNGTGPSPMEKRLLDALPSGWVSNLAVPTKQPRASGYPGHYKIDVAHPESKIAVEVDGMSHGLRIRQEQDAKKQAFLESLGWCVLRFTNAEVRTDLERCVQTILYTTSKSTAITTTSSMAS